MSFTSFEFLIFFLTVFALYWLARERRWQNALLLLASYVFYGWVHPWYAVMLGASTLADYFIAHGMVAHPERKRGLLWLSLLLNLGVLAFFKYYNFFSPALVNALDGLKLSADPLLVNILLPAGLSFYTLKKLGYVLDVSKGTLKPTHTLLDFSLYVSFFPQIVAGPIERPQKLLPQLEATRVWKWDNFTQAWPLVVMGLFKKVVIADHFAVWATAGFDASSTLNFFEAWAASLSYTFQLYFDFSGYTDMAIGAALLFNIRLPVNFNSPYKAANIRDFWRRWHMTLSRFLRDYLYIPLGGNRAGRGRAYRNLFITFLLGGLWHGASWMFVIWGALHGAAMVAHRLWRDLGGRLPGWLAWLITFNFINLTWVFFRAADMAAAVKVLRGMAGINGVVLPAALAQRFGWAAHGGLTFGSWVGGVNGDYHLALWLLAALILTLGFKNSNEWLYDAGKRQILRWHWAAACAAMAAVSLVTLLASAYSEFIYFNF